MGGMSKKGGFGGYTSKYNFELYFVKNCLQLFNSWMISLKLRGSRKDGFPKTSCIILILYLNKVFSRSLRYLYENWFLLEKSLGINWISVRIHTSKPTLNLHHQSSSFSICQKTPQKIGNFQKIDIVITLFFDVDTGA